MSTNHVRTYDLSDTLTSVLCLSASAAFVIPGILTFLPGIATIATGVYLTVTTLQLRQSPFIRHLIIGLCATLLGLVSAVISGWITIGDSDATTPWVPYMLICARSSMVGMLVAVFPFVSATNALRKIEREWYRPITREPWAEVEAERTRQRYAYGTFREEGGESGYEGGSSEGSDESQDLDGSPRRGRSPGPVALL